MAILTINLKNWDNTISILRSQIGELEEVEDRPHVTLLYAGKHSSHLVPYVCEATREACAAVGSAFDLSISSIGCFPAQLGKKTPVVALVECPELHAFRKHITDYLDARSVPYPKDWINFQPHITMGYTSQKINRYSITPLIFYSSTVELWPENEGDTNKIVFSGVPPLPKYDRLGKSNHTVNKGITIMSDSSKKLDALSSKLRLHKALMSSAIVGIANRRRQEEARAAYQVPGTEYGYSVESPLKGEFLRDPTLMVPAARPEELQAPEVVSVEKSVASNSECASCGIVYKSIYGECPRCVANNVQEALPMWKR